MKGLLANKRLLLIVAAVVLGAAGGFGAFTMLSGGKGDQAEPAAKPEEKGPGPIYQLKDRVVNLADQGGRRYLKVGMAIELKPESPDFYKKKGEERAKVAEELKKELTPIEPVVNDIVTTVLSSKTFEEVGTAAGKEKLKHELKEKLEKPFALHQQHILNVYFTEFIVQ